MIIFIFISYFPQRATYIIDKHLQCLTEPNSTVLMSMPYMISGEYVSTVASDKVIERFRGTCVWQESGFFLRFFTAGSCPTGIGGRGILFKFKSYARETFC